MHLSTCIGANSYRLVDYNYIPTYGNAHFPCIITRGTMQILYCIPITCLCGTCLLLAWNVHVLWNVHVSWKYTHVSTCLVEAHM